MRSAGVGYRYPLGPNEFHNPLVHGSSPCGPTTKIKGLQQSCEPFFVSAFLFSPFVRSPFPAARVLRESSHLRPGTPPSNERASVLRSSIYAIADKLTGLAPSLEIFHLRLPEGVRMAVTSDQPLIKFWPQPAGAT